MSKKNGFDEKLQFNEWEDYNLLDDVSLDKYQLDLEAERHGEKMVKWLELLTQVQAESARTKEVLQNKEAELLLKVKSEGIPGQSGKPTDTACKAWVTVQPEYKTAAREKRKADNNILYLQNAKIVLEHRKTMIKVEADLWICGYFAKPHISGEIRDSLDETAKEKHSDKLKNSMSRRHLRQQDDEE